MSSVIQHLKAFNRKERFWLVGMALGNKDFELGAEFRELLNQKLKVNVRPGAFAAMDYHLDWIYASLFLASDGHSVAISPTGEPIYQRDQRSKDYLLKATQEDVDFLVAYKEDSVCHIILLEAKGETGFTNKQLKSKACRLKAIFEGDEARSANACPHFAIVSKHKPVRLKYDCWPNWMHPNGQAAWIQLDMPDGLRKVTRCDDLGLDDSAGKYWKVD